MAEASGNLTQTVEGKAADHAKMISGAEESVVTEKLVRPALKKKSAQSGAKGKKALKWDEVAIEEHDQLRGTRMKIEEPNTPYVHYDSGQESDDSRRPKSPITQKNSLSWDNLLATKLDSVAAVRDAYPSHGGDASDAEERKREMAHLEFKEHRKRHYNEVELMRKYREEHGGDADDEGEEDD